MGIFKRLFGICQTQLPQAEDCWKYDGNVLKVDLTKVPELSNPGSAVRIEDKSLPERILVVHGDDNKWYAFKNKCTHGGRRLDPLKGEGQLECCSVGKSQFSYDGKLLGGSARKDIETYDTEIENDELTLKF